MPQFGVELADLGLSDRNVVDEVPPAAQVDGAVGQGLLHGDRHGAITGDAPPIADRLGEEFPQHNADILHGVMEIDLKVPFGGDFQADPAVLGEVVQHVVEEADPGGDGPDGFTVEDDLRGDVGFVGFAGQTRFSRFHTSHHRQKGGGKKGVRALKRGFLSIRKIGSIQALSKLLGS